MPVIVLRDKTERPEGIQHGVSFLTGAVNEAIIQTFGKLFLMDFTSTFNPYGDGLAAERGFKPIFNYYL